MAVCYNKLWKILIDRGMSKTELIKAAKISTNAMPKAIDRKKLVAFINKFEIYFL